MDTKRFKKDIFSITEMNFEQSCIEVFRHQFDQNQIYHNYCNHIGIDKESVNSLVDIPFLPIEFFKKHKIKSGDWSAEKIFLSSGTTGSQRSNHHIRDEAFYHKVAQNIFENVYGKLSDYQILALLPSYQTQKNSSLINMVDYFMNKARNNSGYFLNDHQVLVDTINKSDKKKLLIGVSYALLDLAEHHSFDTKDLTIIETGGMKGKKREMIRRELHNTIHKKLGNYDIHSEYGMTELMSQAYYVNSQFHFPPWARVLIRDTNDPFQYKPDGQTGGINIVDLANADTCSFIETKDLGHTVASNTFEVLGRFDNSDIRGCNLLI